MFDIKDPEMKAFVVEVLLAVQAAQQTVQQGAQQGAQQSGQTNSGVIKSASETIMEDTATGERLTVGSADKNEMNYLNSKRLFDASLNQNHSAVDKNRVHFDREVFSGDSHTQELQHIAVQNLADTVANNKLRALDVIETANMISKQALRHEGFLGAEELQDEAFQDAIVAKLAAKILNPEE